MSENGFNELNISSELIKALDYLDYTKPTQVQQEVFPFLKSKKNIVVKSQTGSGKTASFAIPMCEQVEWEERLPQVLILTPTRELAMQIQTEVFNISRFKRLKVAAIFGRSPFQKQEKLLKQRTHIVVATPGRLLDHVNRGTIDLSKIETVIIDEADEMLAMGFIEQVDKVLASVSEDINIGLFSATMPAAIQKLADKYLPDASYIEVQSEDKVQNRIDQYYYNVNEDDKVQLLLDVLVVDNPNTSIIFCNTRDVVEELSEGLSALGAKPVMLHGGMEQRDRSKVITEFKQGYHRFLVATDVAARGLDISDVSLVVNFDFPNSVETYTHRIGRTARLDKEGKAITFVNQYDGKNFDEIAEFNEGAWRQMIAPKESLVADKMPSFTAKQERQPKLKKVKELVFKEEITKLHINAGKKTKMRAGDVVGAIANIDGVSADDIGVIDLLDVSTFVEILNGKGSLVMKALDEKGIKGRKRRISKANESEYEREIKKHM
ncbi:DEAD/DEAH box helicase [Vagococcus fessus]|uniref:RNA helicase n=1 Tax=Vagococcus fessus TaxID=120370 RepID=A0A430A533_9ENTE|nr:DEAD/DEAH box helicase [Vagococcus fessus]RSU01920.1 RNA helicase [Vagococcus fessus]